MNVKFEAFSARKWSQLSDADSWSFLDTRPDILCKKTPLHPRIPSYESLTLQSNVSRSTLSTNILCEFQDYDLSYEAM